MKQWTVTELAAKTDLTDRTIRSYCRQGVIKAQKIGPIWAIPDDEAQRFLSALGRPEPDNDE